MIINEALFSFWVRKTIFTEYSWFLLWNTPETSDRTFICKLYFNLDFNKFQQYYIEHFRKFSSNISFNHKFEKNRNKELKKLTLNILHFPFREIWNSKFTVFQIETASRSNSSNIMHIGILENISEILWCLSEKSIYNIVSNTFL